MIDFLSVALPFVIIGIAVAILVFGYFLKKRELKTKKPLNLR
ncbi:hypothetical protein Sgly_0890 [Syntrophobotulus glycolicus DSM 8271]|uniref:Uncharacterized protein n=1 Tax=Syntrophobotulus glycolicus (strain DSM 8271 / FlGlyR) TaxID=645991 RepID=F0T1X2_SYNGF|nr:hypothetical protein Sgly_0890 [Syntrophobotulus glycolicus DSM 8271]